jgi:hypothetical protein
MDEGRGLKKFKSPVDEKTYFYSEAVFQTAGTPLQSKLFDVERVWKLMAGSIDVHIHSAPEAYSTRLGDEVDLAIQACQAGQRAVVFKCHSAPNARSKGVVQKAVDQWAEAHGKKKTEVFGGVTLNYSVGGLNPEAVMVNARLGGKYVWTPTFDSATHHRVMGKTGGIEVLDENGNAAPALKEIFGLIAQADMVLGLCHLTPREMFVLIDQARKENVKRIEIVHANFPKFRFSMEDLKLAVEKGVYIGLYSYAQRPPVFDWDYYLDAISTVGVDRFVFGSDTGSFSSLFPTESIRMLITGLLIAGVPDKDVEKIVRMNPQALLY